jgi:hypothetical protein
MKQKSDDNNNLIPVKNADVDALELIKRLNLVLDINLYDGIAEYYIQPATKQKPDTNNNSDKSKKKSRKKNAKTITNNTKKKSI